MNRIQCTSKSYFQTITGASVSYRDAALRWSGWPTSGGEIYSAVCWRWWCIWGTRTWKILLFYISQKPRAYNWNCNILLMFSTWCITLHHCNHTSSIIWPLIPLTFRAVANNRQAEALIICHCFPFFLFIVIINILNIQEDNLARDIIASAIIFFWLWQRLFKFY